MQPIIRAGLSLSVLLALSVFPALHGADEEKFECDTLEGWQIVNIFGGEPKGSLSVVNKDLEFKYDRGDFTVLVLDSPLTDFQQVRMTLYSETLSMMAVAVEDSDGAKFNYPFTLPAKRQVEIRFKAGDFKLSDDSKVKKRALDAAKLAKGFAVVDIGVLLKKKGPNAVLIRDVTIERKSGARVTGDTVIASKVVVDKPVTYDGNIVIRRGGHLSMNSQRAIIKGNVRIEAGGTFEVLGGTLVIPQDYNQHRLIDAKGKLIFKNATVNTSDRPIKVELRGKGGSYTVENTKFEGGVTCDMEAASKVALTKAQRPGEFIIPVGAECTFTECLLPIFWFALGENFNGQIIFPEGGVVRDFKPGHGLNVTLTNCAEVVWCILSLPGSAGRVELSTVNAVGLLFDHTATNAVIKDLQAGKPMEQYLVDIADRRLRLNNSRVNTWNVYAADKSNVTVEKSRIGEAFAFGSGKLLVNNTLCDGSGGYIGSHGKSEITLEDCIITSAVIARDASTIILNKCEIKGDINVLGTSTIKMLNCQHEGRVNKAPTAKLIREPDPTAEKK